jgi:hypothetical protein
MPAWMNRGGNEVISGGGGGPVVRAGHQPVAKQPAPAPRRRFSSDDPNYERMKKEVKDGGAKPGVAGRRVSITPSGAAGPKKPTGPSSVGGQRRGAQEGRAPAG